jgi:hypothetical protein
MKYIDCIETLNLSKNKIYGDKQVIFEIYKFSNLKVLDISEQLVGSIPPMFGIVAMCRIRCFLNCISDTCF